MLTKTDLQQIQKLMREEIEVEAQRTRDELQAEIKLSRMEINTALGKIEDRLKSVEVKFSKIQKDIDVIISYFDRENISFGKRITRIEHHLQLATP